MLNIRVSGQSQATPDMDMELRFGLMDQCIKDIGKTIRQMVGGDSFMQTEMFMKVNGRMTKHMEKAFISTQMVLSTMDNGKKTNRTDMELKHGQTALSTTELMLTARNTARELSTGLMDQSIMANLMTTIFMETESINGLMVDNMKVNG